jgi:hypothetical protein
VVNRIRTHSVSKFTIDWIKKNPFIPAERDLDSLLLEYYVDRSNWEKEG